MEFSLRILIIYWNIRLFVFSMKTQSNVMQKHQKSMPNIAILTLERWINPENCTPEKEITLADLKEK